MNKLLALLTFSMITTAAIAAVLVEERDNGNGSKTCIYSDGSGIVVKTYQVCPRSK